jgi:hypothetical protein
VHQRAVVLGQLVGSAGQAPGAGLAGDLELLLDRDRHTAKKAYFVAAPQGGIRLRGLTASLVEEGDCDGLVAQGDTRSLVDNATVRELVAI